MKTYTIKLGARIPAYGEYEIEAESAQAALAAFLDARVRGGDVDWEPDCGFSSDYITVDDIVSQDGTEVHEGLDLPGTPFPDEGAARLAEVIAAGETA